MNDIIPMQKREPVQYLVGRLSGGFVLEWTILFDRVFDRSAWHVLHKDEHAVGTFLHAQILDDARMLQLT